MRVGQVAHKFFPSIGGIESYVGRLARDLSAVGDSVTIFTTTSSENQRRDRFDVCTIPSILRQSRNPLPIGALRIIDQRKMDLLHFHSPWYLTSILPLLRKLGVPSITTVHGAF